MRACLLVTGLCVLLTIACDNESEIELGQSCFSACLDADANVDLDLELQAANDVQLALDAQRRTLAAYVDGAAAFVNIAKRLADGRAITLPNHFNYTGNGSYTVDTGDGAVATVKFYWPVDSSKAKAGDVILWNVFDTSSYFTGLSVKSSVSVGLDGVASSLEFGFDEAGPGAELLGFDSALSGSVEVNVDDMTDSLKPTLSSAQVTLDGDRFDKDFALKVTTESTALSASADPSSVRLSVDTLSWRNNRTGQSLSLLDSDLQLVKGDLYDGELSFNSFDSEFSFDAQLSYAASASADVLFGCAGAKLRYVDK
jgi:hypothetical protein